MIRFVGAKINLGLDIIRKRDDGYHDLQTVFYPIGRSNGTPENPAPFCDILEIHLRENSRGDEFSFSGREIDCPLEKNLVYRAVEAFRKNGGIEGKSVELCLDKHIPDGAGLGGGSADASATLLMLNELDGTPFGKEQLISMARELGADCPFFIENRPVYAEGIGEKMTPVALDLGGKWLVAVKPDVYVSTREAFAGIRPHEPEKSILDIIATPIEDWENNGLKNDFEPHIFALHPELAEIKASLKEAGALYAAMSGSGSSIFGIFPGHHEAEAYYTASAVPAYLIRL